MVRCVDEGATRIMGRDDMMESILVLLFLAFWVMPIFVIVAVGVTSLAVLMVIVRMFKQMQTVQNVE